jgi:hypothetical protein
VAPFDRFRVPAARAPAVGGFRYDIEAGRSLGARTCPLIEGSLPKFAIKADDAVARREEVAADVEILGYAVADSPRPRRRLSW